MLFHLEVGNAIAQQASHAIAFFKHDDGVARARQLLCTRHARAAGADDSHAPAGLRGRWLRDHPAFLPALVNDEMLDRLDTDRIVVDIERAGLFTGRGTYPARELRKIIRGMQDVERLAPLMPVYEVVPVGNDVVHRAAGLTERNPAIHAARALLRRIVVLERKYEFAIATDAFLHRERNFRNALKLHESRDLSHVTQPAFACPHPPPWPPPARHASRPAPACIRSGTPSRSGRASRPSGRGSPARACCP